MFGFCSVICQLTEKKKESETSIVNAKVHYTLSISDILNTSGGRTRAGKYWSGSCYFWTLPLDV